MTLWYVALAFLLGIGAAGHFVPSIRECGLPAWSWILPLLLLPFTPLLNRLRSEPATPLVWGVEFGFRHPRSRVSPALVAACALALLAGALRLWSAPLYPCLGTNDLATYNLPADDSFNVKEGWVTIGGYVDSYVAQGGGDQRISIAATHMTRRGEERSVRGKVTLLTGVSPLQYGDAVRVSGVLSTPPEFADFSWRDWLARRDIYSTLNLTKLERLDVEPGGNPALRALYGVRANGELIINQMLPEPYAALANGMLLGIDGNIPDELNAQFNDTSASHVIVISGSNIALISGILLATGTHMGNRRARQSAYWVAVGAIFLYALLVGWEPSVARAAFMGALIVVATALGRRSTALVSLGVAALVMAAYNAQILWDVGFQLSAVATFGLILLVPKVRPAAAGGAPDQVASALSPMHGVRAFVADTLVVSLAATLAVTPLLVLHFQRLSLIGLLTNLLIVPIQPLILVSGLAGLLVGMAGLLPVSQLIFGATGLGLAWTVKVVEASSAVRWANWAVGGWGTWAIIVLCIGAVAGIYFYAPGAVNATATAPETAPGTARRRRWSLPNWRRIVTSPVTLGALTLATLFCLLGVIALPDGKTHLWFLSSERGQAVLIQSPTGRQVLVDGGDNGQRLLSGLASVMGFWDRDLDRMILTTADERTMKTQTEVTRRLQIDEALTTLPLDDEVGLWARTLQGRGVQTSQVQPKTVLHSADGVTITFHAGGEEADDPAVIGVEFGNLRVFLPGSTDASMAGLHNAAAIVVPNLGRDTADEMLNGNSAPYIIIYSDETIEGAATTRYPNLDGVVHLWTDGTRLWVDPNDSRSQ